MLWRERICRQRCFKEAALTESHKGKDPSYSIEDSSEGPLSKDFPKRGQVHNNYYRKWKLIVKEKFNQLFSFEICSFWGLMRGSANFTECQLIELVCLASKLRLF